MIFFTFFLFVLALLLEGTLIALPLVFVVLVVSYIVFEKWWVFLAAFALGIFLDSMLFRPVGQTSLYFLSFLLFLSLYAKKFETRTIPFVIFASLLGSMSYLGFFGIVSFVPQVLITVCLAFVFFLLFGRGVMRREVKLER